MIPTPSGCPPPNDPQWSIICTTALKTDIRHKSILYYQNWLDRETKVCTHTGSFSRTVTLPLMFRPFSQILIEPSVNISIEKISLSHSHPVTYN